MWFGIGSVELVLLLAFGSVALLLYWLRQAFWKWTVAALACFAIAAVVSPADPMSMLVGGIILNAAFAIGVRFSSNMKASVA